MSRGATIRRMRRRREDDKRDFGPRKLEGLSGSDFWWLFDRLTPAQRQELNYAKNGPEFADTWKRMCMERYVAGLPLFPVDGDGGAC